MAAICSGLAARGRTRAGADGVTRSGAARRASWMVGWTAGLAPACSEEAHERALHAASSASASASA
eukprot:scaffold13455_cov57-Phaeocystis_antarctica.AAC.5